MRLPVSDTGHVVGEGHHRATISDAQVTHMRDLHEFQGLGARAIAQLLGLTIGTVRKVIYYQRRATVPHAWKEVARG
jgi:hypothetical protein